MNFTELKARLRKALQNPALEELTDDDCGLYVNDGYRDLSGRYPFHQSRKRCTFDTVIGEERYQLPPDIAAVLRLSNLTIGYKLRKAGDRLIADRLVDGFRTWPKSYVRYRNYVELAPTPSAIHTIEIFYKAIQHELSAGTDAPVLPEDWHNGIVLRGRWYYYLDRGDLSQQSASDAAYKLWLSDKPGEIEEESVDIDSGVELPELSRHFWPRSSRFDDGYFDFRD